MVDYFRPRTLDDALKLAQAGDMVIAAGFTDLFPATSAQTIAAPVLDITDIGKLRGFEDRGDHLRIGAATTWADIVAHDLPAAFDGLKSAALEIGSPQIQNTGTLGGNICNASPAADGVPCLLTLDAGVELASSGGTRVLPLGDFLQGPRKTALTSGEILTAILIPKAAQNGQGGFQKLGARAYLVISIAMVAARLEISKSRIIRAAISVGACNGVAIRLRELEDRLVGMHVDASLAEAVSTDLIYPYLAPISDIRADKDYRRDVVPVLISRLLADICDRNGGA